MLFGFSNSMFQSSKIGDCGKSNWSEAIYNNKVTQSNVKISHWDNFITDIIAMKNKFNVSSYRISVEWSHVEPLQGVYDYEVLAKYKKYAHYCNLIDIKPMFTLHHFNEPLWFSEVGGFEKEENIILFVNYCSQVFEYLHEDVKLWCTINEPAVYTFMGYFLGGFPPFCKLNTIKAMTVLKNLMIAHIEVYKSLKKINSSSDIEIGIVHNVLIFKKRYYYDPIGTITINLFNELTNNVLIKFFETGVFEYSGYLENIYYENKDALESNDFFGLNFYANPIVGPNLENIYGATYFPDQLMGDMYLPVDPVGFSEAIDIIKKLGKPIYITETGIADHTDVVRKDFLNKYLAVLIEKIEKGYTIKGIYFWTYRDNYEWNQTEKLFGFHDVDGNMRESSKILQQYKLFNGKIIEV
jgi:beta-glucosidase